MANFLFKNIFNLASILFSYIFCRVKKKILSEWYKIYTFLKNELENVKIIFHKGFKIQKMHKIFGSRFMK